MIISPNKKKYTNLEKKYLKFETSNMSPFIKIKWKRANKFYMFDVENKKYIDFTSGIFTSSIGYNNKYFKEQIKKAINKGFNHSYHYYNDFREKYISKLIKFINSSKLNKCFLASAGTEVIEAAIKFSRIYGSSFNKKKIGIISIKGNWHGRTMGSQMLSGKNSASKWIGFYDNNIYHTDFPYPWLKNLNDKKFFSNSLRKRFPKNFNFKKKITMVILETFQGWGAIFYPKNYVKEIEKFCKKNNIILCFDEMQSGFGRTGKRFGFQHYNVSPDLICCGKGMGSGFPLSGVLTSKKVMDNKLASGISSTHSSNSLACAAGLATLDEIKKKNLVKKSNDLGKLLHKELDQLRKKFDRVISHTLGKGLIASIIFKDYKKIHATKLANFVTRECLLNGLLVCNTGRESIKLGPPLTIDKKGIMQAIKILDQSITKGNLL